LINLNNKIKNLKTSEINSYPIKNTSPINYPEPHTIIQYNNKPPSIILTPLMDLMVSLLPIWIKIISEECSIKKNIKLKLKKILYSHYKINLNKLNLTNLDILNNLRL